MNQSFAEPESPIGLLVSLAEPTRLRILNCLAAAPLFVSDLQEVLDLPQPTVSRHLTVLKRSDVVKDTSVAPYVLYRLHRGGAPHGRMLAAILEALTTDPSLQAERRRALDKSRARARSRAGLASESAPA